MNFLRSEGLKAVFCQADSGKAVLWNEVHGKLAIRKNETGRHPNEECWVMVHQSPEIAPRRWLPNNQPGTSLENRGVADLREIVVCACFQEPDAEGDCDCDWQTFPRRMVAEHIVLSWREEFSSFMSFMRASSRSWFLPAWEVRAVIFNASNSEMWEYDEFHRLFVPFVERTHPRIL